MATLEETIRLVFQGVDSASGPIGQVASAISGIADPFAQAADAALKLEAAFLGTAAAITTLALSAAQEFSTNFRLISTLVEDTGGDFQNFSTDIKDYARTSTSSIDDINAALQTAIGQGIDYADALTLLATAEKAATANNADLEASTKLLVSTLNAYGYEIDEAGYVSDIFFKTIADGAISLDEMAAGLSDIAPIAAALGVPLETVGAALAILTQAGAPASEAITGLRSTLDAIISPSARAAELAAELGLEWDAAALKSKGLEVVLQEMIVATGGNQEQIKTLVGRLEAYGTVLTLTGPQAAAFAAQLEKMKEVAGATDAAYQKMVVGIDGSLQTLQNAIKLILIEIGDGLIGSASGIVGAVTEILNSIEASLGSGSLSEVVAYLEEVFAALKVTLQEVARNFPDALEQIDFSAFLASFDDLGQQVKTLLQAFFGEIDITTTEGLADALQLVVDSFTALNKVVEGILTAFEPVFSAIREGIDQFNALDESAQLDFGKFIGSAKVLVDVGLGLGAALIAIGNSAIDMGRTFDIVFGGIKVGINTAQAAFDILVFAVAKGREGIAAFDVVFQKLFGSTEDFNRAAQEFADAKIFSAAVWDNMQRNLRESQDGWEQMSGGISGTSQTLDEAQAALNKTAQDLNKLGGAQSAAGQEADALAQSIDGVTFELAGFDKAQSDALGGAGQFADALVEQASETANAEQALEGFVFELGAGDVVMTRVTSTMGAVSKETDQVTAALTEAEKQTESFRLKMEEIASNERIKALEFSANIRVAELETDARRVEAIMENLNTIFESTGDVIGEAFGVLKLFVDAPNVLFGTASEIFEAALRQIELENEIRQRAADDAHNIAESEYLLLELKRKRLLRGEPLIRIGMDGVAPELEALMWAVIERVQLKINEEAESMLLGI